MPDKLTDKEIFENEIKCIQRRSIGQCNGGTDCCKCDLLMNEKDIISAYERAIANNDLINRKVVIEAYKEFAEKIIDKRINTSKYGEVVLLTDIYDTLKELGCENGET